MNTPMSRTLIFAVLVSLVAFGGAATAEASPSALSHAPLAKTKKKKFKLKNIVPSVKFKPKAKLGRTGATVRLDAVLAIAGKSKTISIFNMGLKKKGKSVRVNRKIGKLKVSLTVSWSGAREIVIRGSARYLKFKVPVPKLRLKV